MQQTRKQSFHGRPKEKHKEHRFAEGWVEFSDKRVARSVADLLNANTIGESLIYGGLWRWILERSDAWARRRSRNAPPEGRSGRLARPLSHCWALRLLHLIGNLVS